MMDEGQQNILSPISAMRHNKMTLPALQTPINISTDHQNVSQLQQHQIPDSTQQAFEVQPQLKRSVASDEEIEIMTKRKGKVTFSSHHPPQVVKHDEDPDDITNGFKKNARSIAGAFKRDQKLLNSLLNNCKGEDIDSKISMKQLRDMINESKIV